MTRHGMLTSRRRWCTAACVVTLAVSLAFGAGAINADDPATGLANNNGSLNPPPPTAVPSATPTTVPATATTPPSTTSAASPAGTAAPAAAPAASATSGTPAASATGSDAVAYEELPNGGGGNNVVKVQNKTDNRLRVKAKIQLNHIPGNSVQPVNYAQAIGSCTDCQTFAVALQIDLRNPTASVVAPQNAAIAINANCVNCLTVADAYQFVVPVDDPTQTPENVKALISQMQQELNAIADTPGITAADAEARVNAVIARFSDLANSLYQQRDQSTDNDTPGATVPPDAVVLTPAPNQSTPTSPGTPVASGTPTP